MRLELIRVGLLVELANHYTTRGAHQYTSCDYEICQEGSEIFFAQSAGAVEYTDCFSAEE